MENEQKKCPNNDVNSNRVRKSLFVLNAGKVVNYIILMFSNIFKHWFQTNLNVNAVSFSSTRLPIQNSSNCSAGCSHYNNDPYSFPRGLVMNCNPQVWRNISCRNLESPMAYEDNFRQPVRYHSWYKTFKSIISFYSHITEGTVNAVLHIVHIVQSYCQMEYFNLRYVTE